MRLVPHAKLVDLGGLPEGWDLADDAPDGVDIAKRLAEAKTPKGVKSGNGKQKPGAKAKRSKKDDLTQGPLRTQSASEMPFLPRSVPCAARPSTLAVPSRRRRLRPTRQRS